ncbi:hypothetical protein EYF80_036481 [Liparis tanakae]|uniref:Uncharacterized protein n=1 Tax=Liparis tanakae TaxID=230148 RepID=A0A4Z2GIJ5_9TELE|nr:hypothetical protein EYF80_036481 [Liparis tanakae]
MQVSLSLDLQPVGLVTELQPGVAQAVQLRMFWRVLATGLLERLSSCCSMSWNKLLRSCFCSLISLQPSDSSCALDILSSI